MNDYNNCPVEWSVRPNAFPVWQPYQSPEILWNTPQFSNSPYMPQNLGFGPPQSPDFQAFNYMNLQAPMGAHWYMGMRATTTPYFTNPPPPDAYKIGDQASTSRSTPLTCKYKQNQIVQGQREPFTHFISIPLAIYPELKNNLEAFKTSVLGNNNPSVLAEMGIEHSLFASPKTFHLTVVMLKLPNKDSMVEAQNILKSISSEVSLALKNQPVFVKLKGLKCMTGSLDKTSVLYAPVEEVGDEGRLLSACHIIIDAFASAGFAAKDAKSHFKLHATVMNSVYRKDKSKKKDPFDAQEIHKEFGNKDWGTYLISEAHISQRFMYDPTSGYFHCCASLPFPH